MPSAPPNSRHAYALAVASLLLMVSALGVLPLFLEHFTQGRLNGLDVNAARYVFAALMFLPSDIWLLRRMASADRRRLWRAGLVPALAYVVAQVFYGLAPYWNNATMLNFGCRLSIPFTTLFGFLLIARERALARSKRFWSGLAMALAGFVTMFAGGFGTDSTSPAGMALLGCFAVGWGLYVATVGRFLGGFSPVASFGVVSAIACPFHIAIMLAWGHPAALLQTSAADWLLLFISSFLGLAFANVLMYFAMHILGPVTTDASMLLVPFLTALAAHLWAGETLRPLQWVAGLVLLLGCALLIAARFRHARQQASP